MEEKSVNQQAENESSNSDKNSEASGSSSDTAGSRAIIDGGSTKFVISQGVAASPPQFVSLDEIMSAANGVINMHLAHEIVLDQDFRLEKYEPPQNSLEKVVKEVLHKAFWDMLVEELNDNPPRYTRAMLLLEEIKTILLDLLPPQNTKLKQEINEMLDIPLIQQQAENDSLDFPSYAHYVLGLMSRMCAPVRDDDINELKKVTGVVDIFKGIFEVLTQMKLDLANFNIQLFRPELLSHSVEYEKARFAELLKVDGGIDSLKYSKKWLRKYVEKSLAEKSNCSIVDVMAPAYLELLKWDKENPLPETVIMDAVRLQALACRLYRLIITGTILLVTLGNVKLPVLQNSQPFKDKLIKEVGIVLQDTREDNALKNLLPNLALHVIGVAKKFLLTEHPAGSVQTVALDPSTEKALTSAIQDLENSNHPVRNLVGMRVREFLHLTLASLPKTTHQVPPGLTALKQDLLSLTANVVRLYEYNQAVFGEYYLEIISKLKEEISSERAENED